MSAIKNEEHNFCVFGVFSGKISRLYQNDRVQRLPPTAIWV